MREYTQPQLVAIWDEMTDPEARLKAEDGFFAKHLESSRNEWIFDSAAGVGYEALDLQRRGFEVVANEADPNFRRELEKRVAKRKLEVRRAYENEGQELCEWSENRIIPVSPYDWRELPRIKLFGGVLCVGNSITYLMEDEELEKVIGNFAGLLFSGGKLIVDHRNYDYILDNREEILAGPGNKFRSKKKYYYIGDHDPWYIRIEDHVATQEIRRKNGEILGQFTVHPRRVQEITEALQSHGLEDRVFSDFVEGIDMTADFFQHVAVKV